MNLPTQEDLSLYLMEWQDQRRMWKPDTDTSNRRAPDNVYKAGRDYIVHAFKAGLSYDEIAKRMGMNRSTVQYWYMDRQESPAKHKPEPQDEPQATQPPKKDDVMPSKKRKRSRYLSPIQAEKAKKMFLSGKYAGAEIARRFGKHGSWATKFKQAHGIVDHDGRTVPQKKLVDSSMPFLADKANAKKAAAKSSLQGMRDQAISWLSAPLPQDVVVSVASLIQALSKHI